MKPITWWDPQKSGGLLSRRWAQAHVFPLPQLRHTELQASLHFKVQALLPSQEQRHSTRIVVHRGKPYGLVLIDRLPDPQPDGSNLFLGVPFTVPSSMSEDCLLAISSPEGWEIHGYENRTLTISYPPTQTSTPLFRRILELHPQREIYWVVPDPTCTNPLPLGARLTPLWKDSPSWGIPWEAPKQPRWPWYLGTVLLSLGLAAWVVIGFEVLEAKQERNHRWEDWVKTATTMVGNSAVSAQTLTQIEARSGERVGWVLESLANAWPSGVVVQYLEVSGRKFYVTARATSALDSIANLAKEPMGKDLRVLQIRPVPGGEEFDLEGPVEP